MRSALAAVGAGALIGAVFAVGILLTAIEILDGRTEVAWLT